MRIRPAFLLVAIPALAVGALAGPAFAASPLEKSKVKKITVTSAAFGNNKAIPSGFTCDGSNASPPLKFAKIPKATKDVALIMTDPDAPSGTFVHWVAWHLPKGRIAGGDPARGSRPGQEHVRERRLRRPVPAGRLPAAPLHLHRLRAREADHASAGRVRRRPSRRRSKGTCSPRARSRGRTSAESAGSEAARSGQSRRPEE